MGVTYKVKKVEMIIPPKIVEPTANLDSENSHHIMEIMQQLNKELKTSFIFATHDEKIMGYLRRIVHLDDGQINKDEQVKNPKYN